jgi:hypothetical protein
MNYVGRQLVANGILIIAALASMAVAGASLRLRKQNVPGEKAQPLLPVLVNDKPVFLALVRGAQEVHLVKNPGTTDSWFAQSPVNSPGDSAAINAAVTALRGIQVIRRIERVPNDNPRNLSDLGLEKPRFIWQLGVGNNKWTLTFGDQAPGFRGGTYLTLAGPTHSSTIAYVVDANNAALDLMPEQVIDSRLIHTNGLDVREIEFESPQVSFHARHDEEVDHWFEVEQPRSRLESGKFSQLLNELRLLKGKHFTDLSQVTTKGDHPAAVLRLLLPSREIEIEILSPCLQAPDLMTARVSGDATTVACADFSPLLAILSQEAQTWRDTRLFALRTDQVESVRRSTRGERMALRREGMGFTIDSANPVQVDIQTGNEFLTALLAARGQAVSANTISTRTVFDLGDYLQIHSSVVGRRGEYQEKLLVGPPTASGDRFVKRAQDNAVLRISEATAELLRMDLDSFKRN